jgi:hypothetical protein
LGAPAIIAMSAVRIIARPLFALDPNYPRQYPPLGSRAHT